MKKIIFLLISLILYAFDSSKVDTTIISTTKHHAIINKPIQAGMSGYVIHNNMMIAKAISNGKGNVTYLPLVKLKNSALATPKIYPQKGDKIIFGLYNKRWLLIAPNQQVYLETIKNNPNINFISSDIFANYFTTKPTQKDFQKFCADFNVGIINFILDKNYKVDCNSFDILEQTKTKKIDYKKVFFANYNKFTTSLFSSKPKNWINYYKALLKENYGK